MENVFNIKEEPADGAHSLHVQQPSPHATDMLQQGNEPQPLHWTEIKRETSEDESGSPPQHSAISPTVKVEECEITDEEKEDECFVRERDALAHDVADAPPQRQEGIGVTSRWPHTLAVVDRITQMLADHTEAHANTQPHANMQAQANTYAPSGVIPLALLQNKIFNSASVEQATFDMSDAESRPHQCDICQKSFAKKKYLNSHMLVHASKTDPTSRPHRCDVCERRFTKRSYLAAHALVHSTERPFTCAECQKTFTHISHLNRHALVHSGELPYCCPICTKGFTRKEILKRHLELHSEQRPYPCDVCHKTFKRKENLKAHQNIHTEEEKSFRCEVCDKCFKNVRYLKKHGVIHTGERPYSCDECGKSFTDTSSLSKHRRTHTGERPFKCAACGKCYTDRSSLSKHKRTHTLHDTECDTSPSELTDCRPASPSELTQYIEVTMQHE